MKTTRKQNLLSSALVGALTLLGALTAAQAAEKKPNIVHIVADDLGWKDVGFNGCADIKTPNIDALAAGGARFTQFYVQPMCTPTRACLMTGRYPFRYGLQTAVIPGPAGYGLNLDEYLLPQVLKGAGYQTAIIGKWHLGHADKKFWPKQRGFDYQYGAMIGELDYYTHSDAGVLDWFRNNERVKEKGYTTQLIGSDTVKYIYAQDPNKPFYIYVAFNAPHTPYQAPKEYIDRYPNIADLTRRTYAGMIACLDDEIGRVVAALDKKGIRENTLILFHSDNGGVRNAMFAGQMTDMSKLKLPCDNGPYRDGKGSLFEGACRVAACANWPGHVKAEEVTGLIHAADMLPTFAALAGASTAKCKPLDGVNVWDVIAKNTASPRNEIVYNVEPFRGAVRQGDWKLIWRTLLPSSVDLYNLAQDPYEQNNVAAANPDKVAALKERLEVAARESAKPLLMGYVGGLALKHGKPQMAGDASAAVAGTDENHSPTDEDFGDVEAVPAGHR
jgi:arylsulfatase A-like enzyme